FIFPIIVNVLKHASESMKYFLFLFLFYFCLHPTCAQEFTGRVIEAESKIPLAGATIIEQGTGNGVVSDEDGNFSISLQKIPAILQISFLGYRNEMIRISFED